MGPLPEVAAPAPTKLRQAEEPVAVPAPAAQRRTAARGVIPFTSWRPEVPLRRGNGSRPSVSTDSLPILLGEQVSLLKYVIAGAIGYYAGQPGGQRQLQRLRQKATELASSPQARQLKECGRNIAKERASATLDLARRKRSNGSATTADASGTAGAPPSRAESGSRTGTGFGGRTAAEDTQPVRTGTTPPPPVGRTTGQTNPTQEL
jgi:hypothetical protein